MFEKNYIPSPLYPPLDKPFFDTFEHNDALRALEAHGVLVRSTSKYSIFEYFGSPLDLSGLPVKIQFAMFEGQPHIVSMPTTYLLKFYFKWQK